MSTDNMQIAKTILEQLGGRKFTFMCGVKHAAAIERGLSFRIPGTMTRNRINYVKITLEPSDTYKVDFGVIRGHTYKIVSTHDDIYCDDLAELFRSETGLETRMPAVRFA